METKKWTKQAIAEKVETSQQWAERAILALFKRQTLAEQKTQETQENNGKGFNSADARILSSMAEYILKGYTLTPKQLVLARRKLRKYAGQLAKIANQKVSEC